MKASELIKKIENLIEKYGDLKVLTYSDIDYEYHPCRIEIYPLEKRQIFYIY
jgi:hypothetical protein